MAAAAFEIGIRHPESLQRAEVVLPQCRELVEQAGQRSLPRRLELREAIEFFKGLTVTALEDHSRARHPVGPLAVNQMPDDVEGAPRVGSFVCRDPVVRNAPQQCVEHAWRARQDVNRVRQHEGTPRHSGHRAGETSLRAVIGARVNRAVRIEVTTQSYRDLVAQRGL